ncbi:MAG TPA: hypothetical protein PLT00_06185 [Verrucomicrobiota bacterium]|jgi:hypothetical protein|nr:hypothetical protein [Verrucomicrobiota bacterium]OQB93857.1 MAG: hypothetical protein BWX84_00414 [Verrucomicrobia bacterium ADurb.Bin118]HPY29789.1 hypothetical protein [Verrucomicrobiota bacterium]HQB16286.1 hypothetical protein [Verrucomicrobiota bacterium]
MADDAVSPLPLRPDRREHLRLVPAFVLSVIVHLLIFGTYKMARHFQWREDALLPPGLKRDRHLEARLTEPPSAPPAEAPPLVFINVSPRQATPEPPKETPFYSDKNSLAANPEADQDTGIPKITGTQELVPKTEDVPRNRFDRLQPMLPAAPAEPEPPAEPEAPATPTPPAPTPAPSPDTAQPRPAPGPGQLALTRPEPALRLNPGPAARPRPRTLAEARARLENQPPGQKMKQEGGVRRRLEFAALDAKATPFGAYDAAFINAVSQRWYDLLDAKRYDGHQRGKVVVQFALHYNGRITDMTVLEKTVGEDLSLICEMAVLDPAPYAPWPSDLRRLVNDNQRRVQFTFFYN